MRYSDELLEEIKSKNDIIDIISEYVILKRSGRNFFGLCPFHKEKSPSFSVSPEKQIFHCFGCGIGGDVFKFISKIENISFRESIELLAERANVQLPINNNSGDDKLAVLKEKVYKVNEFTAKYYHENLYKPTAKPAQEYVKKRRLDNKTLKKFLIGYSGKFDELYRELRKNGFEEEEILASGLVNKNRDGKYIDRYRNRLMFPILNIQNKVIAFGGRVLDDSKPKYINSPENIVYSKGRNLFAMNIAKQERPNTIIMVEGYMDAISLHQRGISNVVASLGTALTEAQGRLLRKSCEKVIIGYDADGAGQAATLRGLEILYNLGCDIRILQIEGAKDPDEFVVKYGAEKFQKYVEKAISLVEFKVKMLKKDLNLEIVNDKVKFLNEVAKILSKVENKIEREIYIDKISKDYKVSKEAIFGEINKLLYKNNNSEKKIEKPVRAFKESEKETIQNIDEKVLKREKLIIYLLLNYPTETYKKFEDIINEDLIKDNYNREIIHKLYEEYEKGNSNIDNIMQWFENDKILNYLSSIMISDFEINDLGKSIQDIINTYQKESLIVERNSILAKLENIEELSEQESEEYERKLNDVIIKLAKMK